MVMNDEWWLMNEDANGVLINFSSVLETYKLEIERKHQRKSTSIIVDFEICDLVSNF